jgi:hypothetical protein
MRFETKAIHDGQAPDRSTGAVIVPVIKHPHISRTRSENIGDMNTPGRGIPPEERSKRRLPHWRGVVTGLPLHQGSLRRLRFLI